MSIFMIATIKKNKQLIGIRLHDSISKLTKDVPVNSIISNLSNGVKIKNLAVHSGQLWGTNGSMDRYDITNGNNPITIIADVDGLGFDVVDCNGNCKRFRESDIIKLVNNSKMSLSNGKVVEKDGKTFISSINGEYDKISLADATKKENVAEKTEVTEVTGVKKEDELSSNRLAVQFPFKSVPLEIRENEVMINGVPFIKGEYGICTSEQSFSVCLRDTDNSFDAWIDLVKSYCILKGLGEKSTFETAGNYVYINSDNKMYYISIEDMVACKDAKIIEIDAEYRYSGIMGKVKDAVILLCKTDKSCKIAVCQNGKCIAINDISNNEKDEIKADALMMIYKLCQYNAKDLYSCFSSLLDVSFLTTSKHEINKICIGINTGYCKCKYITVDACEVSKMLFGHTDKEIREEADNRDNGESKFARWFGTWTHLRIDNITEKWVEVTGINSAIIDAIKRVFKIKENIMASAMYNHQYEGTSHYGALEQDLYKNEDLVCYICKENETVVKKVDNSKAGRMHELVDILNKARAVYEQGEDEIMSNFEYDKLYDELLEIEKEIGTTLRNSPTQNVGYEVISEFEKETHPETMLSLDKTKVIDELASFIGTKDGVLSLKMDGLTIVLTYKDGKFFKAVTRGDGDIGEVVTNNARQFKNIPLTIPFKGELVVRGEAIITYSEFNKINSKITIAEKRFKNPRNLCAGSVRQLNSAITAQRNVLLFAFDLVSASGMENSDAIRFVDARFKWLNEIGFKTVEYKKVTSENIEDAVQQFSESIGDNDIPSDGLVLTFNDVAYGKSLGNTAKFPRHSIAFKWKDTAVEAKLIEIEWGTSRTGLINPVGIFEPVNIEGSTVSRASLHNVSIMKALQLGVGDTVKVYKANMIIPQICENLTRSDTCKVPEYCPKCGAETEIHTDDTSFVETLYCTNPDCEAKEIKLYTHFVTRDAMNIDGLSEATLERLLDEGLINEFADIYKLEEFEEIIVNMEGFGVKSYSKLIASIDKSRNVKLANLIYAFGIPNVGLQTAKLIAKACKYDIRNFVTTTINQIINIDGIGDVIASSVYNWLHNPSNAQQLVELYSELNIIEEQESTDNTLSGLTFCCTGAVYHFSSRNVLKDVIEGKGGKLTGSVTSKTDYLITNDTTSGSAKNKTAQQLNIPIITEQEFIDQFNIEE